jgi:hypothetical protein
MKVVEPEPGVYPVRDAVATALYVPLGAEGVTRYKNAAWPLEPVTLFGTGEAVVPFG